jgi:phasin protein
MKSHTSRSRNAKKRVRAMSAAAKIIGNTGDLLKEAGHVATEHAVLAATPMIDPLSVDRVEFATTIPEETIAFPDAYMTWLQWSGEVAEQMASFTATEMSTVSQAVVAMASCRTPAGMIAAQSSFATAWFARALSHSAAIGSLAIRSQSAATAPFTAQRPTTTRGG